MGHMSNPFINHTTSQKIGIKGRVMLGKREEEEGEREKELGACATARAYGL